VTEHPYKQAPDRAFWSRSVSRDFDASSVADAPPFLLTRDDRFMSAGSCFASNVRSYLEGAGYRYTVTEAAHPLWSEWVEEAYYEAFSARYGNIYTARQMVQLLERGLGSFQPAEEYWQSDGTLIDPFRPGLRYRARSVGEFRALTRQHLRAVLRAVEISSVFVFTLGLTEAWVSTDDEAVFPACPGTVAGAFDERRHKFRNFSVEEVTRDLVRMVSLARSVNPSLKVIITVSPVPLVATASGQHVLVATTYSKSVLRVAADQASRTLPDVAYFPAYELVTGPQSGGQAFEADRRNVCEAAVANVMEAFFSTFFPSATEPTAGGHGDATQEPGDGHLSTQVQQDLREALASALRAACEEEMQDESLVGGRDL